jgi:formylglycine-generating enzyme
MSMQMKTVWSISVLLGFVLLLGCDKEKPHTSAGPEATPPIVATGTIRFEVSFAPWHVGHAKLAAIQTIDKVTAYVYAPAGSEIKQADLSFSAERASGRITVPAQENLRVALAYFDGSMVRWIGEDTDVDVSAGGETVAEIVAEYMGTSVTAPDSAEIGEDYTVSWMSQPFVTEYELQEATAADFSGAVTYTSADTFKVVSGKGEATMTYYYRARVNTDYGYGPWHSTGSASTGTYATEGVIVIDVPIPPDEPSLAEMTVELPGGATIEFVWIDPGSFRMGSSSSEAGHEEQESPIHEVTISKGFYLGKYEITQRQWEAVIGTAPWFGEDYVQNNPDHPAQYITWNDVQEFIERLNEAAGKEIYRLPTEAEWEYACRAGTTMRWSFGDDESQLGDYAWYRDNAWDVDQRYGHAVGMKQPNPWGLYDMHGNVYEWCQDWYGSYSSGSHRDPTGPSSGSNRVIRGGYFFLGAQNARSASRSYSSPDFRNDRHGVRLLRTP